VNKPVVKKKGSDGFSEVSFSETAQAQDENAAEERPEGKDDEIVGVNPLTQKPIIKSIERKPVVRGIFDKKPEAGETQDEAELIAKDVTVSELRQRQLRDITPVSNEPAREERELSPANWRKGFGKRRKRRRLGTRSSWAGSASSKARKAKTHLDGTRGVGVFDVYLEEKAFEKASAHFKDHASRRLEALGFLVGGVYSFEGRQYVMVEDYVTAENDATAVTVRFSREAFKDLSKTLSDGVVIVGWCHSHPGYGCFLSSTDVRTQKVFFPEDFHIAVVCDPLKGEWKAFKLSKAEPEGNEENYREVSFAVVREK